MAEELPDDLLEDLVAAGTPEEVRRTIERFGAIEGVDAVRTGFLTRGENRGPVPDDGSDFTAL